MHFGQDAEEVLQYKEVEEDDGFRENGKFGARELCRTLPGRRGVGFFEPTISSAAFDALRGVALVRPRDVAQGTPPVVRGAREARKRIDG